jgi:ferredoxin-thioredoxin reductase catalytic subunit
MSDVKSEDIENLYKKLDRYAESSGYHLNSDLDLTKDLIKGLLVNERRYGYLACPCRLATGEKSKDLDIICPCDYRDDDLNEYGSCYCALYISKDILNGKKKLGSIPERRPQKDEKRQIKEKSIKNNIISLSKPVWRCKVCGYLCGKDSPPEVCPICKAKKERFERFI